MNGLRLNELHQRDNERNRGPGFDEHKLRILWCRVCGLLAALGLNFWRRGPS